MDELDPSRMLVDTVARLESRIVMLERAADRLHNAVIQMAEYNEIDRRALEGKIKCAIAKHVCDDPHYDPRPAPMPKYDWQKALKESSDE